MRSVIVRVRALGYEPEKRLDWAVGAAAREEYASATEDLPVKELRVKTSGKGSHCMAVYPDWFIPRLDEIVREIAVSIESVDAAQGNLF